MNRGMPCQPGSHLHAGYCVRLQPYRSVCPTLAYLNAPTSRLLSYLTSLHWLVQSVPGGAAVSGTAETTRIIELSGSSSSNRTTEHAE